VTSTSKTKRTPRERIEDQVIEEEDREDDEENAMADKLHKMRLELRN
jgi:hypothetical protein